MNVYPFLTSCAFCLFPTPVVECPTNPLITKFSVAINVACFAQTSMWRVFRLSLLLLFLRGGGEGGGLSIRHSAFPVGEGEANEGHTNLQRKKTLKQNEA